MNIDRSAVYETFVKRILAPCIIVRHGVYVYGAKEEASYCSETAITLQLSIMIWTSVLAIKYENFSPIIGFSHSGISL